MSSSPLHNERIRRTTSLIGDLLKKSAGGALREKDEYSKFMYRAVVIAMDTEGGKLETPDGQPEGGSLLTQELSDGGRTLARYTITPTFGPRNPKNSVRARIISSDLDQFVDDDHLRTYWPMFPGNMNPGPGELVYVIFEDKTMKHGLWLGKVPNDLQDDNANFVMISETLRKGSGGKNSLFNPDSQTVEVDGQILKRPNRLSSLFIDSK